MATVVVHMTDGNEITADDVGEEALSELFSCLTGWIDLIGSPGMIVNSENITFIEVKEDDDE